MNIMKDIVASTLAGTVGLAICHPLDTIRIRMQLQQYPNPMYKTMWHCGAAAIRREGVKGLFKGVISSSLGAAPIYTVSFTSYEMTHRMLAQFQLNQQVDSFLAGFVAGIATWVTTVPAEMLKCRAQADKWNFIQYRSALRGVWEQKGIRGIYQGWWVTFVRDVPCSGIYFWWYDTITAKVIKPDDDSSKKYTTKAIAGGLAGLWDWIPTYGIDVVKTKIQTDRSEITPTMWETARKYYKSQGIRFFFKGILPTCCWCFPWNAIIFIVYDELRDLFGATGEKYMD